MGLLLQSKSFLSKKFCFNQNFETRRRLHINLYIMGRPFNMNTIISMYTEITFAEWRTTTYGHLLKVLVCLFLYLESNQVIILWKVAKRNKKEQKPNFLLSLLTLLESYQHYQTFFVIFYSYSFQMKQISTLETTTSEKTGNFTFWA